MPVSHLLLTNKKIGWNGEAAMVLELAEGMARRGYRVTLATHPASDMLKRLDRDTGVEVLELCLRKEIKTAWTFWSDFAKLARHVRREGVDVVHTHASFDTWTASLALRATGLRTPLVRTKHNLKAIRPTLANRWCYGRAIDCFIAPSRAVEAVLHASELVRDELVHRIPYGLPIAKLETYDGGRETARSELDIAPDDEVVGYVSRLTERKDPATLVRAVARLASSRPKLRLLFVGSDHFELEAGLRELADGAAVTFLGHRSDVPRILAAIDLFVLPSRTEAFGLAPIEAMLRGVPTIVSDADGFRDFARDGDNALVFPKGDDAALADRIKRALDDSDLRRRLAAAGERTVRESFYAERMVEDTQRLYREIA